MKKIKVSGWIQDNTGTYHKPGAELTVSDADKAGCIDQARAKAVTDVEAARAKAHKAAKPARASKPRAAKPKPAAPAQAPCPPCAEHDAPPAMPETPPTE